MSTSMVLRRSSYHRHDLLHWFFRLLLHSPQMIIPKHEQAALSERWINSSSNTQSCPITNSAFQSSSLPGLVIPASQLCPRKSRYSEILIVLWLSNDIGQECNETLRYDGGQTFRIEQSHHHAFRLAIFEMVRTEEEPLYRSASNAYKLIGCRTVCQHRNFFNIKIQQPETIKSKWQRFDQRWRTPKLVSSPVVQQKPMVRKNQLREAIFDGKMNSCWWCNCWPDQGC